MDGGCIKTSLPSPCVLSIVSRSRDVTIGEIYPRLTDMERGLGDERGENRCLFIFVAG